jgi:hypothetical protein
MGRGHGGRGLLGRVHLGRIVVSKCHLVRIAIRTHIQVSAQKANSTHWLASSRPQKCADSSESL